MKLYIVRNKEGQYFRAKGYGGRGQSWVAEMTLAKFYAKMGPAKGIVTFFAKNHPEFGTPSILEFTLAEGLATVIDMEEETKKSIEKINKRKLAEQDRRNAYELQRLLAKQQENKTLIKTLSDYRRDRHD